MKRKTKSSSARPEPHRFLTQLVGPTSRSSRPAKFQIFLDPKRGTARIPTFR